MPHVCNQASSPAHDKPEPSRRLLVFENPAQALKNTAADSNSPWIKLPELPVESEILKSVSLIDLPIAQPQLVLADSAARRGRLSAMPLKPLRAGAAHVVQ